MLRLASAVRSLRTPRAARALVLALALTAMAVGAPGCGGGGDTNPTGGVALIAFLQAGITNVALNQVLEFRFSEAIDKDSLSDQTFQIREGAGFGSTIKAKFRVSGSTVFVEPRLAGNCDLSDSGFKPNTVYRVTLVGYPEIYCLRGDDGVQNGETFIDANGDGFYNLGEVYDDANSNGFRDFGNPSGDALTGTLVFEFTTRLGDDPLLYSDQIPGASPAVTASLFVRADLTTAPTDDPSTPYSDRSATQVHSRNAVVLHITENLNACTVNDTTVQFHEYQRGDPAIFNAHGSGRTTGFDPVDDADAGNPFSWGPLNNAETTLGAPQRILSTITLAQDFSGTTITVTPRVGRFPENALCVVQLTFGVKDFGGQSLVPFAVAFTTENLPAQSGQYAVLFEGETPFIKDQSTADVDTARSPNRAQGWLLFAGDADNGSNQLVPSLPNVGPACVTPLQANDGAKDDFDPNADVVLDTGLTVNTCLNKTDGSTAVVWEFRTFRIRSGRVVRIRGVNPAIILVQGDVNIETGGRLLVKGDGGGGVLTSNGENGTTSTTTNPAGGTGHAGAGHGGNTYNPYHSSVKADDGRSGYGSTSPYGTLGGVGAGIGGIHGQHLSFTASGSGYSGGGGGHSDAGMDGQTNKNANVTLKASSPLPTGGGTYPSMDNRLLLPSAGSGAGGGGYGGYPSAQSFAGYDSSGGGGGAGGGFLDLTGGGNVNIFGTVDASGGRGGSGSAGFYGSGAGGGGGSGGGLRILTPNSINVNGGTITAAGGAGGAGAVPTGGGGPANAGGAGGKGRLVFEDQDSVVLNAGTAALSPNEGDAGFNRGVFDPSRFKGGGLEPQLISDVFLIGPTNPQYVVPLVSDFVASIPTGANRGATGTAILIEARGFEQLADGTADLTGMTGVSPSWRTVGYFRHSGVGAAPTWIPSANPPGADIPILPAGNAGPNITALNGREYLQLRITFYLPSTIGPFDPGPILDSWIIRFTSNQ